MLPCLGASQPSGGGDEPFLEATLLSLVECRFLSPLLRLWILPTKYLK